jgi:hypothetical protein
VKTSGAKSPDADKLSESSFNTLLAGVMGIPIAGLGIIIGLMSVMKQIGFSGELIVAFTLMSFLLLVAAEAVFIRLLLRRTKPVKETADNIQNQAQLNEVVIKGLNATQTRGLNEPIPSVIENTTRNLEPIPRKSKT